MPEILVLVPVGALLIGLLLELVLAGLLPARIKGWLAFISSCVALGGVLAMWPLTVQGLPLAVKLIAWDGPIQLAYYVDGLSQLFALMAAGIGAAILLYSIAYMAQDSAATRFYALMLLFIAGLVHLVYSADLFLVYFSWEIIGLCSFLLVGFWYKQREAAAGARKVLVMTHLAGYGLLATVLILFTQTGSTLWTDPQVAAAFSTGLFLLTLLAAVAKSVQFPLHTWIPEAMAAPTPVSALLHAACYVKAGVYLVARLYSLGPWPAPWQTVVIWIGTITLLVGGLYGLVQSDLKRLLAFSTVSQIGYIILGLGLGTPLGIAAGLLHCLNHGLFKGGLFLCAGAVQQATGTRSMDRLGGLAQRMPKTTALWLVVAGSVAGVPLSSGFVSKWLLYNAALEAGQLVPALIAWVVSVITIFYFLKATTGIFLGDESPDVVRVNEAPRLMLAGTTVLAAASLVLGIAPQLAINYVINPALVGLGIQPVIAVSWLGLTAGSGSWFVTGGLILALVSVGVGLLLYGLVQPRRQLVATGAGASPAGGGVFSGGEPLTGPARLPATDFALIIQQGLAPFYRWVDVDRYYLSLWRGMLKLSERLELAGRWMEQRAVSLLLVMTVLLAMVVGLGNLAIGESTGYGPVSIEWPLPLSIALAALALSLTATGRPQARQLVPLMVGAGLLSLLGLLTGQPWLRLVLLEGAAVVALILVWQTTTVSSTLARYVYLLTVFLSAVMLVGGMVLLESSVPELALPLLLAGFALKLALAPLYLWLPVVAETAPAAVVGLVAAVVDMAALVELLSLRQSAPWLFAPAAPWLALAGLSAVGGAILMLAQQDLKRLLAFSTIEDMGYLLLGVALAGELGLTGALAGAAVHALAKALLFASLAAPETEQPLTLESRGLAARYPVSAVGFLLGALAVLGVPPTLGYAARWRLYGAAAGQNLWLLALLLLATGLAVLA